jgi:putative aldouronate transport system permease protein
MRTSRGELLFYIINYAVLTVAAVSCLLPLLHIVSLSLSGAQEVMSGSVVFWPKNIDVQSYDALFKGTGIVRAFGNSVVITVVGVLLSMLLTIIAAYPLSRKILYGRKAILLAIVFTMLFSGGLIPLYLLVKALGLVNTYAALWLPGLITTFNMLILRSFFENIPEELFESSRIDGCGEWRLLASIVLPLSLPALATIALFYGVHYWNAFMSVLIYINDTNKHNMTVLVQNMVQSQSILQELNMEGGKKDFMAPEGVKAAGIIVMTVPMLAVYPFIQKYFVKGVMLGSVKG